MIGEESCVRSLLFSLRRRTRHRTTPLIQDPIDEEGEGEGEGEEKEEEKWMVHLSLRQVTMIPV